MQGRRGETGGQSGLYGIIRKTGGGEKERGKDKVWAVWDKWQGGWGERTKSGLKGIGLKGVREREKRTVWAVWREGRKRHRERGLYGISPQGGKDEGEWDKD